MQWLTTDWLGPNNQAVRQELQAHVQGPLFGRKAHRRSLGFARDDKGEGSDFYWEPLDRDGQKETAGQIRLKVDDCFDSAPQVLCYAIHL
jgi:hypothetical protein